MCFQNSIFSFLRKYNFFRKNCLTHENILHLICAKKSYIHFLCRMTPLKNAHVSPKFFSPFFPKMLLFSKKLLDEKIFRTSFLIKKAHIYFRRQTAPSFQKGLGSRKWFFAIFFQKIQPFLKKLLNKKYSVCT